MRVRAVEKSDIPKVEVGLIVRKREGSTAPRETLTRQALRRLIGSLKDGKFTPGSKLPSQGELVKKLGISRTGVREALQAMSALDLIEIHPGLGCFVKKTATDHIINEDVLAIILEKEAILDVVETRKILEAGSAPLVAQRATERDFWNMEDALSLIERAVQRGESVAEIAPAFHNAIAEASHNAVLAKLIRSFNKLMARAGKLVEAEAPDVEEFKRHELDSHRELYNVVRTRDPIATREAMTKHISDSEDIIVKAFQRAEAT
jgi:GntR family transcriptional repressor for pyruvate dehydrogenase complex